MGYHKTDYLGAVLDRGDRADFINKSLDYLRPEAHRFDAIAVRGMSGAAFGGILAHLLDKHLIIVRKPGDNRATTPGGSHSSYRVEGPLDWNPRVRYLIVDDFESTGDTIQAIKDDIGDRAQYAGKYLYKRDEPIWDGDSTVYPPIAVEEPALPSVTQVLAEDTAYAYRGEYYDYATDRNRGNDARGATCADCRDGGAPTRLVQDQEATSAVAIALRPAADDLRANANGATFRDRLRDAVERGYRGGPLLW